MDIHFTTAILTYPVTDPTRSTGAATPTTACWLPGFPVLAGDCRSCCFCDRPNLDQGLSTLCWETNQIFSGPEFIEYQGLDRRVLVAPRKLCSSGTMEIVCLLDSLESRSFPR